MKKYLITGLPSGGKTTFAGNLKNELEKYASVRNDDVDHDDWKFPGAEDGIDVYILQTPHGSRTEEEDSINPGDFDEVIYIEPPPLEYAQRLIRRGLRWFKEGRSHTLNHDFGYHGRLPYCPQNALVIFRDLKKWFFERGRTIEEDVEYFEKIEVPLIRVRNDGDELIEEIVK